MDNPAHNPLVGLLWTRHLSQVASPLRNRVDSRQDSLLNNPHSNPLRNRACSQAVNRRRSHLFNLRYSQVGSRASNQAFNLVFNHRVSHRHSLLGSHQRNPAGCPADNPADNHPDNRPLDRRPNPRGSRPASQHSQLDSHQQLLQSNQLSSHLCNRVISLQSNRAPNRHLSQVHSPLLDRLCNLRNYLPHSHLEIQAHNLLISRLGNQAGSQADNPVDNLRRSRQRNRRCSLLDSHRPDQLFNQVGSRPVDLVHSPHTLLHGPLSSPLSSQPIPAQPPLLNHPKHRRSSG